LLGDGSSLGVSFRYAEQAAPNGLAEAFIIGRDFVGTDSVTLVLGDNIFHGSGLQQLLQEATARPEGCVLFGYRVRDPERYGVVELDSAGRVLSIEEKPQKPKSQIAVTGLYVYDNAVIEMARGLRPSARGELEITDINQIYARAGRALVKLMGRGMAWLDTGTHDALLEASQFVGALEKRQGTRVACIEEVAYRMGFIDAAALEQLAQGYGKSEYGAYLRSLLDESRSIGEVHGSS